VPPTFFSFAYFHMKFSFPIDRDAFGQYHVFIIRSLDGILCSGLVSFFLRCFLFHLASSKYLPGLLIRVWPNEYYLPQWGPSLPVLMLVYRISFRSWRELCPPHSLSPHSRSSERFTFFLFSFPRNNASCVPAPCDPFSLVKFFSLPSPVFVSRSFSDICKLYNPLNVVRPLLSLHRTPFPRAVGSFVLFYCRLGTVVISAFSMRCGRAVP